MAIEKTIKIKVDSKDAVSSLKKVEKGLDKTGDQAKQTAAEMSTLTGSAGARFSGMIKGIKGVALGFKSLRFAIAASGIGLLLIALVSIKAAFEGSEEGQNKFAKLMGVIGSVTGNFVDLLATLGEKIISIFENPKQAIKDFVKLLKENVINRFNGLLELIPQLAKAVKQLFKGDFSAAAETAGNAVAKVTLGVDNLSGSIRDAAKALKELAKEVADDAASAAAIADKRAKADKIERNLIVQSELAKNKIADLRFKSEQRDKFAASERVEFLKEASKIAEEISAKEIAANKLRLDAKIAENKLNKSNKDDLNEVAQLQARAIQLDTAKLNLQKRLQTSITTFQNEELSGIKAINDAKFKAWESENNLAIKREEQRVKDAEQAIKDRDELQGLLDEEEQEEIAREDRRIQRAFDDAEKEKQLAENVANAKAAIANNTFALISMLAVKGSKLGKAAAAAGALVNTYQGVTAALAAPSTIPEPFGSILKFTNAATVGVMGLKNVKNILSTKDVSPNGGAPSIGGGGSGGGASAPSFNLVAGTGSNQIAESLSNQDQPLKAFVVSSDVSTSQSLDRNIVENSSL
jgi:hypothetical protein